ncbi:uncharacterized protein [Triticum aestivum]|nr:uncharacterized protein LOC123099404 [Triticum aestivum]
MPADNPSSPCDRRHPHILLDKKCLIGFSENSTAAKTKNSQGLDVEVSLKTADPPAISLCFARCVDHQATGNNRLAGEPFIHGIAGGFILLAIAFLDSVNHYLRYIDYFVYKAGGPRPASLHLLPRPYPSSFSRNLVAVLPISDDDSEEDFALVFPRVEYLVLESRRHYTLLVYRSDTNAWRSQVAYIADEDSETMNAKHKISVHRAMSVAYAEKGVIGWIDLWWGILLCNVLDSKPIIRFVPLPISEPCDPSEFHLTFEDLTPRPHRHVTICNGLIKFVGLNFHADNAIRSMKQARDHGWTARTWTRSIYSDDVWHDGMTIDTSEIYFTDPSLPSLLPGMFDEENNLTWGKFTTAGPTLSLLDDDIIYIMAKESVCHRTAYVLAVNTKSSKLESGAQCSAQKMRWFEPTYEPCLLFSSFGTTSELVKEFETKAAVMEIKEGPILSVLSERLHALRKQQNRVARTEESVAAGKTLSQEQKEAMRSKPILAAVIDELERLRAPLAAALAEELSTISAPAAGSSSI